MKGNIRLLQRIATMCLSVIIVASATVTMSGCDEFLTYLEELESDIYDSSTEATSEGIDESMGQDETCDCGTGENSEHGEQSITDTEEISEESGDMRPGAESNVESDIEADSESDIESDTEKTEYDGPKVLTYANVGELSSGKNIVMFVVDRFDENYYETMISSDPDYFDRLDGFTHYNDYTSLYARTYPAVASMLTGRDHDYLSNRSKATKLNELYSNGGGKLGVLKELGYSINIYTGKGNSYAEASVMADYVDNVSRKEGETACTTNIAAYREQLDQSGFNLVDGYGQFTFIHLYGCHDTSLTVKNRITVTFDLIYYYLDQMKALGIYDDATIIITGDHPAALSDSKMIGSANSKDDGTRVTAMFFKRSGESGTPLRYSSAQISQDELWNSIFESEEHLDEKDGESFFDIPEGEDRERRYIFELYKNSKNNGLKYNKLIEYKITGSANNGDNWKIEKETDIVK